MAQVLGITLKSIADVMSTLHGISLKREDSLLNSSLYGRPPGPRHLPNRDPPRTRASANNWLDAHRLFMVAQNYLQGGVIAKHPAIVEIGFLYLQTAFVQYKISTSYPDQ